MNIDDIGYGVTTNPGGDVFIAGSFQNLASQGKDIVVAKVAGVDGAAIWSHFVNGTSNLTDEALDITVDSMGFVLVAGYVTTATGTDVWVRKLNVVGANPVVVWTRNYNNAVVNGADVGTAVVTDSASNVIVAGYETVANQGTNIWIRKYDTLGNILWTQTYDGPAHLDDQAKGISVDSAGNVIVAGFETKANATTDAWIRKYSPAGAILWTQSHNGAGNTSDSANDAVFDSSANIYVCGFENTGLARARMPGSADTLRNSLLRLPPSRRRLPGRLSARPGSSSRLPPRALYGRFDHVDDALHARGALREHRLLVVGERRAR